MDTLARRFQGSPPWLDPLLAGLSQHRFGVVADLPANLLERDGFVQGYALLLVWAALYLFAGNALYG